MGNLSTKDSYLAKDEDFEFVPQAFDGAYSIKNKGIGYFHYIGGEKIVEVPHIIQGHKVTYYYRMFKNTEVEEVISKNKDITNMSYMFEGVKIDRLKLYEFDTSNVTSIEGMFYDVSVDKIDLCNFNTENVTNMSNMFAASKIKRLNLSNFNTRKVTSMSHMFYDFSEKDLDLSSFDTSNIENMAYMFSNSNIKELNLTSFDTSNVTNMDNMFSNSSTTMSYARTQEDADRFNDSKTNRPSKLMFVTKPKDK